MIPVTNAIVTCLVAMGVTAVIVAWTLRGYWRARVDDAYQDGHTAGIATQIGRQQRAQARLRPAGQHARDAYLERARPPAGGEPATDVIVADITTAGRHHQGPAPGGVIPFPEGLPDGLREYATAVMAAWPPSPPAPPPQARGEASLQRVITLTRGSGTWPR